MKYIKGLNTIRAIAVLMVIKEHFGVWFNDATPVGSFINTVIMPGGRFGVDLFYVLSGFLITSILLKAKTTVTNRRFTVVKNFFIRRALRIFPIYYLLLFLLYFINYPDIHRYFVYFLTYTTNILVYKTRTWNAFSHVWTLAVEEQFYLFWPWLMIFVNNKYLKYILFASVAVGVVTTFITMEYFGHGGGYLVFNNLDAFGIGGLYAWARLNDKRCKQFITTLRVLVVPAIIAYFFWQLSFYYHYNAPYQSLSL